jgi:hypothetical protein
MQIGDVEHIWRGISITGLWLRRYSVLSPAFNLRQHIRANFIFVSPTDYPS